MGVLGMFRAGAASSHGAGVLCPSRPRRSVARSQLRRGVYSVSTSALSARCALPIRMLLRPRTLRYRLLSRKRSLAALVSILVLVRSMYAGATSLSSRTSYFAHPARRSSGQQLQRYAVLAVD